MTFLKMSEVDLTNKKVLIREDLNVPLKDGKVTSDARIKAVLPTIELALSKNAAVMVMSHLGRPKVGSGNPNLSLAPVAERLSVLLKKPVRFEKDWLDGIDIKPGEVVLCENVRFNRGEKENDLNVAEEMAALCDVFVMDAFATAHRAEASTVGICHFAKVACAGPLLISELENLDKALENPKKPLLAIVGGAKISTKLKFLESLAKKVDYLIVGGGIANTFVAGLGYNVGGSLYEPDLVDEAERVMELMKANNAVLPLPKDVVVADEMTETAESYVNPIDEVDDEEKIFDIGPKTIKEYVDIIKKAGTILWNGPVGVFEIKQFSKGTQTMTQAIADSDAVSIAGGGDTLAAIDAYKLADKISYISTGGGAFLSYLQGEELPVITALKNHLKIASEA